MPYAGGMPAYRKICADVAARNYDGFVLSARPARLEARAESSDRRGA
jgi:hypothetical protein